MYVPAGGRARLEQAVLKMRRRGVACLMSCPRKRRRGTLSSRARDAHVTRVSRRYAATVLWYHLRA